MDKWDKRFMDLTENIASWSSCCRRQVGAIIVIDKRIIATGYNGAPNNWKDDKFPWDRHNEDPKNNKYPYVIHAEMNALLNYKGDNKDLDGSTVYVTLFPCHECAKVIIQTGIKRVVYLEEYHKPEVWHMARVLFKLGKVKYEKFTE